MEHKFSPFDVPLWRLPTVLAYTGLGRTAWLMGVKSGDMPQPINYPNSRAVAWRAVDVKRWTENLS